MSDGTIPEKVFNILDKEEAALLFGVSTQNTDKTSFHIDDLIRIKNGEYSNILTNKVATFLFAALEKPGNAPCPHANIQLPHPHANNYLRTSHEHAFVIQHVRLTSLSAISRQILKKQ